MSDRSSPRREEPAPPAEEELICTFEIDLAQTPAVVRVAGGETQTLTTPPSGTLPLQEARPRGATRAAGEIGTWDGRCQLRDGTAVPVRVHAASTAGPRAGRLVVAVEGHLAERASCPPEGPAVEDPRRLLQDMRQEIVQEVAARVVEEMRQLDRQGTSPTTALQPGARTDAPAEEGEAAGEKEALTARELALLRLVAQGMDNQTIAAELKLSEKTVTNRLSEIYQKLRVRNRTQAALYALRKGWA